MRAQHRQSHPNCASTSSTSELPALMGWRIPHPSSSHMTVPSAGRLARQYFSTQQNHTSWGSTEGSQTWVAALAFFSPASPITLSVWHPTWYGSTISWRRLRFACTPHEHQHHSKWLDTATHVSTESPLISAVPLFMCQGPLAFRPSHSSNDLYQSRPPAPRRIPRSPTLARA